MFLNWENSFLFGGNEAMKKLINANINVRLCWKR